MSNPDKFPFGSGGFNTERITSLTYRKYFNQRLLNVDGRFSFDLDYLFCAQYIVESSWMMQITIYGVKGLMIVELQLLKLKILDV
uniref:Uncharacterized protein n=1 Tax=Amphimedon queenslandica TaxID=400682 RepID=A0A1X7SDY7_AMPQE